MLLVRLLAKGTVLVFTGNSPTRQWLQSRGIKASAIALTRNAPYFQGSPFTNDDAFKAEPVLRTFAQRKIVLFFARLSNLKGAGDLPTICARVLEARDDSAIVICGLEGSESAPVHRALQHLERTGRVAFMGFVSESIKEWLFAHAHVVIAPSYEEGWGGVVTDAVATGCWVVTYDLPAVRESCPHGPVFIRLGDVHAFSLATVDCLSKPRPAPLSVGLESWRQIADGDLTAVLSGVG
jgi:glycosyltransferase involved in cell wall biosynthesis